MKISHNTLGAYSLLAERTRISGTFATVLIRDELKR